MARASNYLGATRPRSSSCSPPSIRESLNGLVAYSPSEYLAKGRAARDVEVPVYIDQASSADEVAQSASILQAVRSADKQQLGSRVRSTRGSSTLRADANPSGADAHWKGVLKFLTRFNPPQELVRE